MSFARYVHPDIYPLGVGGYFRYKLCSLEELFFMAVSRPTPHSSKFLNVIHKNCKYMHVDKDIHRTRIRASVLTDREIFY